jgi:hypothetical protein
MHVLLIYACDSMVIWYCYMTCSYEVLCGLTWVKSWTWARTRFACLFMCRCFLRRNVVDDGLKLGLGRNWGFGTKFREELRSYQSRMSCRTFGLKEQCTWRDHSVRRTRKMYGLRRDDNWQSRYMDMQRMHGSVIVSAGKEIQGDGRACTCMMVCACGAWE